METKKRFISAVIGGSLAIFFLLFAPVPLFIIITCGISILGLGEYLDMFGLKENRGLYYSAILTGILSSSTFLIPVTWNINFGLVLSSLFLFTVALFLHQKFPCELEKLALVFMGGVYISLFLYFIIAIRLFQSGKELIFLLSAATWGRDVFAFIFGKIFKSGHLILPSISSRKTYEGAAFGSLLALIIVGFTAHWFSLPWTLTDILIVGIMIGVSGQIGDFVESWLKRNAKVTDSSHLIPGQGGILDTFDSFVFTAPLMYFYLLMQNLG